jgi:hypothetical protein
MQHPRPGIQHKAALLFQTAKICRKDRGTDRCHVSDPPACRHAKYRPRRFPVSRFFKCGIGASGGTAFVLFRFAFLSVQPGPAPPRPPFSGTVRESLHIQSHYLLYMKKLKKSNPAPFFHGNDAVSRFFSQNTPCDAKK